MRRATRLYALPVCLPCDSANGGDPLGDTCAHGDVPVQAFRTFCHVRGRHKYYLLLLYLYSIAAECPITAPIVACFHTAVLSSIFMATCVGILVRHAWRLVPSSQAVWQRTCDAGRVALPTIFVFGTAALCGGVVGIIIAAVRQQPPLTSAHRHGGFAWLGAAWLECDACDGQATF